MKPIKINPLSHFLASATKVPVSLASNVIHHVPKKGHSPASLLFLHGLFGSKLNFSSVSRDLLKELEMPAYSVDLRNHGDSVHAKPYDYNAMAADVINFVEERGIESTYLVGHSMGAKVGMMVALKRPDLVRQLVSVDNSPISKRLGEHFYIALDALCRLEGAFVATKKDKAKVGKAHYFLQDTIEDRRERDHLLSNYTGALSPNDVRHIYHQDVWLHLKLPVMDMQKNGMLQAVGDFPYTGTGVYKGPSLFCRAKDSEFITEEGVERIQQLFPNNKIVDFDAGHWIIQEKKMEWLEVVLEFLREGEKKLESV